MADAPDRAIVLMYHRIAESGPDPHGLQVAPGNFARHLDVLARRAEVVSLSDVLLPASAARPRVAITFDDGYRDNLIAAKPALDRVGAPATVFVTSGFLDDRRGFWIDRLAALVLTGEMGAAHLEAEIDGTPLLVDVHTEHARSRAYRFLHRRLRVLTPEEIDRALGALFEAARSTAAVDPAALPMTATELRELAADELITIGAHSVTHPRLSQLDTERQRQEIVQSGRALGDLLGVEITSFAYPYGAADSFDEHSVAIARECYELAVTTETGPVGQSTDRHRIPRYNVGNWDAQEFEGHLDAWW